MSDFLRPPLTPSPSTPPAQVRKRRTTLKVIIVALLLTAGLILFLPLNLPLPLKIAVAASDLLAAAVLGLFLRQSKM